MHETHNSFPRRTTALLVLAAILIVVAVLMVDKHTNWLELRLGSGTASAMALAAEKTPAPR